MLRVSRWSVLLLLPALALTLAAAGCGESKDKAAKSGDKAADKKSDGDKGGSPAAAGELEPLTAKGVATLKGKVAYDGDPPQRADLSDRMKDQGDKDHCLKGDTKDQVWMVGPDKGVQNVVVWVRPPKGKYFKLASDDQKKWSGEQPKLDQPFCQFIPHVLTLYPSYFDGKKQESTGQKMKVVNSAPIGHNTAWQGQNPTLNPGWNEKINPNGEKDINAKPAKENRTGEDLLTFRCDLHKWMNAYAWVFDHPFSAVTKEDGTYEIKNVPAGAELEVVYWHESMGTKPKAEKKTLQDGENDFSPKVKK
jgi:hypothetical protein